MSSKTILKSKDDILKFFNDSAVPKNELMMGIEIERSGIFSETLKPVNYTDKGGYLAILNKLVGEMGWKIITKENNNIVSLKRGETFLHIEVDGRFELASKPRLRITSLNSEFTMHNREIREISNMFGVQWVYMGWNPFAKNKEIKFAPTARAQYFKEEALKDTSLNNFSKKINGVHVNFGFTSERDAMCKFRTILKISPILTAMFANSPIASGKFSGFMDNRLRIIQNFDPKRNMIRKEFFKKDFNFEKWVDFVISLPMTYIKRGDKSIFLKNKTFKQFLEKGHEKIQPQMEDFALQLKSIWNECRIKNYLEYRAIDCVPPHLLMSIPAIIRGITFDANSMQAAQDLTKKWSFNDHLKIRQDVCKNALATELPDGTKILNLAKELLEIANTSLKNNQKKSGIHHDISRFLWPIKEYVFVREQSPAEYVMEQWNGEWHKDPRKLLEWSRT